jgi:hypothetical protein
MFCLLVAISLSGQLGPEQAIAADESSGITQEQVAEILQELKAIRRLLEQMDRQQARPAPPASAVSDTARVECPFCKRFHQTTFKSLSRDYIDTGKVRWVVLDLPLPMHPNARQAAQAAHCAGEQQRFWQMREALFENAPLGGPESLRDYGQELGLDEPSFQNCLASEPAIVT